ncbi:MAG: hypothetical protein WAQ27_06315 [Candidatus Microsaccharimonas sp.]
MARVIVGCWQETYLGLMADAVLDDPDFLASRDRFWSAVLTEERFRANRVAVAERDSDLIRVAMSGVSNGEIAAWVGCPDRTVMLAVYRYRTSGTTQLQGQAAVRSDPEVWTMRISCTPLSTWVAPSGMNP